MAQAPREEKKLTLIHFGDLHLWAIGVEWDLYLKRLLGMVNLIFKRSRKFSKTTAEAIIDKIASDHADYVLFSGDLTTASLKVEFEAGQKLFEPIEQRWGKRFIAIPGNHDRYTTRSHKGRLFEELFFSRHDQEPFQIDLDAAWSLVGVDVCVPRMISSRGMLHPRDLTRMEKLLSAIHDQKRRSIVLSHYPLVYPEGVKAKWEHVLPQRRTMLASLLKNKTDLFLHGHKHERWRLQQDGLTLLNCGSAGQTGHTMSVSPGYLRIELSPEGVQEVTSVWLDTSRRESEELPGTWIEEPLPASDHIEIHPEV